MPRAALLSVLALCLLALAGCWPAPVAQSPASTPLPTTAASPAAVQPRAPAKPTVAVKPTSPPSPAAAATAKPTGQPPSATTRAAASPPAVVATSVSGLPAVVVSPASSAAVAASPAPGPAGTADTLGVAASAGTAAAANASDSEATALCGPGAIMSTRAGQMAGRSATVAIARVAASYQPNVRAQPTFLNDAPYPNHVFTAVIWGRDRRQFQPSPESWQDKALCVSGPVELYQQRPQIVVSAPSQLRAAR